MVSLCTVILNSANSYLDIYVDWVVNRTKLIKEVCFCKVDAPASFYEEKEINGIKFKKFGYTPPQSNFIIYPGHQHALGLHECIDRASQPYIFLCDPDIFFYTPVDEFYYNTMKQLDLDIIGASHHAATEIAQGYFPWHGNLLVKKDKLPNENWMQGKFAIENKYLLMDAISGYTEMFPNSKQNFDTGSYLWLWGHEQKWKWLSFLTVNCHDYTTMHYRSSGNVVKNKFIKQRLFYHAISGTIKPSEIKLKFSSLYEESKKNND